MKSLLAIAGNGFDDTDGQYMPNLSSIDTVAILGLVTPGVISAIDNFNKDGNGVDDKTKSAVLSTQTDGNGKLTPPEVNEDFVPPECAAMDCPPSTWAGKFITGRDYLQYQPYEPDSNRSVAWVRSSPFVDATYEVYYVTRYAPGGVATWDYGSSQFQFLRQIISDWQRMLNASASALAVNAASTTAPANQDDLREFLSALRAVCNDLDTLNENPPELGKITDALRYALAKSSEFAGKAVAEISKEVGKDAGIIGANLSGGFLENAGILSFVVVGLVIHMFLS